MTVLRGVRVWLAAVVVFFGLVTFLGPTSDSTTSRIAHLESLVRCPACEGLSVAQSTATSSLAVRHEIARKVRAGVSDSDILTSLESRYGTSILLSPATSGVGTLLWLLPLAALVLGGAVYVRVVRRT